MSRTLSYTLTACVALLTQTMVSCIHQQNPELVAAREELAALREREAIFTNFDPTSYEYFVSHKQYPVNIEIYKNTELMEQAAKAPKKCKVVICLAQQRGRLYVDGEVAADWPVSTGIPGRDTPAGKYSIVEKKENYASNRYGKMYDAQGLCINSDADAFVHGVPAGGKFEGSPMPYWMRLTWDGVGMHIGKVAAGKRLSHGCIRTPRAICPDLYKTVTIGTRVFVNKELEPEFPAHEALALSAEQGELERNIYRLQKKVYDMEQAELAAKNNW